MQKPLRPLVPASGNQWLIAVIMMVMLIQFVATLAFCAEVTTSSGAPEVIRIAVRAYNGTDAAFEKWGPTNTALNNALPALSFELVPMVGFDEMRSAVAEGSIDFLLTNPATYIELVEIYGVRRIVTLVNMQGGVSTMEFGAVAFARSDRRDITSAYDLGGFSVMGVHPEAFGGWRMAVREWRDRGIDPWRDCREVLYSPDETQDSVVLAVFDRNVDIGIVRTGVIEKLVSRGEIPADAVKVLDPVADDFPFPHTTRLYPEWPLAALSHTPNELVQSVAAALLSITPDDEAARIGGYTGWSIPLDYLAVRGLMEDLKVRPYETLSRPTLEELIRENGTSVLVALLVFVFILGLFVTGLVTLNRRLRRTQGDLRQQHARSKQLVAQRTAELQMLFEAADSVAFISTELGTNEAIITGFSRGAENIFGYSTEEAIGQSTALFSLPESIEDFDKVTEMVGSGNRWHAGEITLVRKSGEHFAASLTINPLYGESGKVIGTLGVAMDVTERRHAQNALVASQNKFEAITNQAIEGITVADMDGNYTLVNRSFCEMMGYAREELLQMSVFDVKAKNQDHSSFERSKTTKEGDPFQVVLERKDGTEFISEVLGKVVEIDGVECVLGIVRDITERTEAEKALRESEERLVEAQKAAKLGHYILDVTTGSWSNSVGLDKVFGIDEKFERDLTGWLNLVHPDFQDELSVYFQDQVLGQGQKFDREYKIICHATGEEKWVHGLGNLKFDENNNPVEMFGVIQDITEKVKLEEQLRQAQKMESIGRLAGGVAHDFNNMLGVILGHAELAMDQVDPKLSLHADLEEIRSAAKRSADLTRQLLAFARKQTISPVVLDINDTVAGMLTMLRRLIGEDIDLAWQPGSGVWSIKVDPSQVDQILVNLCVNSRDAIAGIGEITIKTENKTFDEDFCADHHGFIPGDYVVLSVGDNGEGMDEQSLARLYEPFFTTKELGKGTGLGLAMVYGIIKQNNGFIDVYSEPSRGTLFKIYLPRQLAAPAAKVDEQPAVASARGHETILLVEDESLVLDLVTRMIESLGYTVLAAATPAAAVLLAEERAADISLLCTDVVMPGMSGVDLVRSLKQERPDLKCLFMSGYAANVLPKNEVHLEEMHFVQKPFSKNQMATKIREILDSD